MREVMAFLLLTGCNAAPTFDPRDITGVNPVFTTYVADFEALYHGSIGDVPIQFGTTTGTDVIGDCMIWNVSGVKYREIKISEAYWNAISNSSREALLFHELGHCVLNRDHVTTTMWYNGGIVPTSFMYPYTFFNDGLLALKTQYDQELFDLAGKPMLSRQVGMSPTQTVIPGTPKTQ